MELGDGVEAAARVDGENVLVEARSDRALQAALDMVRPLNWHGTGAGCQRRVKTEQQTTVESCAAGG